MSQKQYEYKDGFISAEELRSASPEVQWEVMEDWFRENFISRDEEGSGVIFIAAGRDSQCLFPNGGPYEPDWTLGAEFSDVVPENVIFKLANELWNESPEWAPTPDGKFYEPDVPEWVSRHPFTDFGEAVAKIKSLLHIDVHADMENYFHRLLYVNAITALEAYLSDTFIGAVSGNADNTRRLLETQTRIYDKKMSAPEIYKFMDKIDFIVRDYLLNKFVWHRLKDAHKMYKEVLKIDFAPEWEELKDAVRKRHTIVHRNGKPDREEEIDITREMVLNLVEITEKVVKSIEDQKSALPSDDIFCPDSQ